MDRVEIPQLIEKAKQLEIIIDGLDDYYSPNHIGQTTERHCDRQFNIADSLSLVASLMNQNTHSHETIEELSTLEFVLNWNYSRLTAMIENEKVKDKPALYVTQKDLEGFFNPLLTGLTDSDLKVLIAVCVNHDIGKVNPEWAKGKLNLDGVEFIAHDYDSRTILENNPQLLSIFELSDSEKSLVLDLVKLHSLPGQYFFGEGNLSGYQPILDFARRIESENPLKIARIHGLIDVMSALNHGFVKPILNSHSKLSEIISRVYLHGDSLGKAFLEEAKEGTKELDALKEEYDLSPIALYRLLKLTGLSQSHAPIISSAMSKLDPSFITQFDHTTSGETTWYGTYVANAFGSGLKRAFGDKPTEENLEAVIQATVKAVSLAAKYHNLFGKSSYALSSVTPGLMVVNGKKDLILDELDKLKNLEQGLEYCMDRENGLYMRGNINAVEISYKDC